MSLTAVNNAGTLSPELEQALRDRVGQGQFGWFLKIGATPQAVAVLNDQPILFTILIVVLIALILQSVLIWYIHYATMKPEQKKKKGDDKKKPPAKK